MSVSKKNHQRESVDRLVEKLKSERGALLETCIDIDRAFGGKNLCLCKHCNLKKWCKDGNPGKVCPIKLASAFVDKFANTGSEVAQ